MQEIHIERLDRAELEDRGVFSWPTWEKGVSSFPWTYDQAEQCYILEGEADIETPNGEVHISAGDFVTFPQGLSCTWRITAPIRKHYHFL